MSRFYIGNRYITQWTTAVACAADGRRDDDDFPGHTVSGSAVALKCLSTHVIIRRQGQQLVNVKTKRVTTAAAAEEETH